MTSPKKKTFNSGLPAFSLVELLVALAILSIGVTAAVSALIFARSALVTGGQKSRPMGDAETYFAEIYTTSSVRKAIISPDDEAILEREKDFPLRLPDLEIPRKSGNALLVRRTVLRARPLLAELSVAVVRSGAVLDRLETAVSEACLDRMGK